MLRAAVALLALVTGCGPQLDRLVSQRHYREAICAARDGSSGERARVTRALAADADVHVHVEMVRAPHLARVVGGDLAEELIRYTRFARVRLQTNVMPVDAIRASGELTDGRGRFVATPVSWDALAAVTGERLPPKERRSTYAHGGTLWRIMGAVFTAGVSLPFTRFSKRTVEVDAPDAVYRAVAPRAHALHTAMPNLAPCHSVPSRGDRNGVGASCEWYVAIDPDPDLSIKLDVSISYASERRSNSYPPKPCELEYKASIALGRVGDLDETTGSLFGARMRALRAR